jgi:hypothetical protein
MNMDCEYAQRHIYISMLDYVSKARTCFRHHKPPQHQPYPHVNPNYSTKAQFTVSSDSLPALPKEGEKFIQEVLGTFLYYARCVDSTMLATLGSLATQQANPTKAQSSPTMRATWFLQATAARHSSLNQMHTAKQVVTFLCPTTPQNHPTTAQFLLLRK